jgi:hypothetical protein
MPDNTDAKMELSLPPSGKKKINWLIVQIILGIPLPPILVGFAEYYTGWSLPQYIRDSILVLVVCVESLIMICTTKMVFLFEAAQSIYEEIINLGNSVKKPLEDIGKIFYDMKDLLPIIAELLSKVDKKWLMAELKKFSASLNTKKLSAEELSAQAKRLSKALPGDVENAKSENVVAECGKITE